MWDGTGLCIFMKRLEEGRFAQLRRDPATGVVRLSASELALFVEGCTLVGRQRLSPDAFVPKPLAGAM
jgi:transposase